MHLHIRIGVNLISTSQFTHFLRFSVSLWRNQPTRRFFKAAVWYSVSWNVVWIVVFSQVFCSAQVAPAEVPGYQEGNQKRSDGGTGKRSIHESGQTQIRSCELSSFFWCTVLSCSPSEVLSGFVTFIPFFPFLFFSFILPFFLCLLDCQFSLYRGPTTVALWKESLFTIA